MGAFALTNINNACPLPVQGFAKIGQMIPWSHIDHSSKVFNGSQCTFDLLPFKVPYPIYERSINPFKGTKIDGKNDAAGYYPNWTELVVFPILAHDPANSDLVKAMSDPTERFVFILEQINKGTNDGARYPVFGLRTGLTIVGSVNDASTGIAWLASFTAPFLVDSGLFLGAPLDSSANIASKYLAITGYELIPGMTINIGDTIAITVDSDKVAKVKESAGTVVTSTSGAISTTSADANGAIILQVPKVTTVFNIDGSDFIGVLNTKQDNLSAVGCTSLTGIIADEALSITATGNTALVSISAKEATTILAGGCALTNTAIAALLAQLVFTSKLSGTLTLTGGTNASQATWTAQAVADKETLVARGWTITNVA